MTVANPGYYSIKGLRHVLECATDILIDTPEGQDRIWGDRWEHLDGVTLTIWREGRVMATYLRGEWTSCQREDQAINEIWPEQREEEAG